MVLFYDTAIITLFSLFFPSLSWLRVWLPFPRCESLSFVQHSVWWMRVLVEFVQHVFFAPIFLAPLFFIFYLKRGEKKAESRRADPVGWSLHHLLLLTSSDTYNGPKDERNMTASTGTRPSTGQAPDDQWLFTKSDLRLTPSVLQGGLEPNEEKQRRFKGVGAIYRMGEYMRLAQHVMNTAAIYLHRFYMRKPLEYGPTNKIGHSHYDMAATCVFLACKVEESHRKLPSVIDAAMASFDKSPAGNQRWMERSFRADPSSKVRAFLSRASGWVYTKAQN